MRFADLSIPHELLAQTHLAAVRGSVEMVTAALGARTIPLQIAGEITFSSVGQANASNVDLPDAIVEPSA